MAGNHKKKIAHQKDHSNATVAELRHLASKKGIKQSEGGKKLNKNQLIRALRNQD